MHLNECEKLTTQLNSAVSINDIESLCEQFCQLFSFEYYVFAICKVTSLVSPNITSLSNYPSDWLETYWEQDCQKHDPVVKYSFENTAPIRWDKLVERKEYISPEGLTIMQNASEMGLVNGLSIPYKAHTGEISVFSLSTNNSEDIDNRMLSAIFPAQSFGSHLFNNITRIKNAEQSEKSKKLTPREIECLFWACEGKTTWEISKIIKVSERTAIFHLTGATQKLGATNRQHAVAKAILGGLIQPRL
ncbi:LuxR family transcriptional regulator [Catenovulum sp. SM1970]|uniref:helix-turn-helix transcriptional regulator n=1 Tax=Marinifaba aquimaris TaxID=2741323 RepID=UPI001573159A|nr:LuxR family transcriptional regulator [Marinifaba aquimaris]NTS75301.1 LuxR family transcriptional regulator [Marinifaba aquimaris]